MRYSHRKLAKAPRTGRETPCSYKVVQKAIIGRTAARMYNHPACSSTMCSRLLLFLALVMLAGVPPGLALPLRNRSSEAEGDGLLILEAERGSFPPDEGNENSSNYAIVLRLNSKLVDLENRTGQSTDPHGTEYVKVVRGMMTGSSETSDEASDGGLDGKLPLSDSKGGKRRERGTDPFSVEIEGTPFFGGLVTYSHAQHPAQVCRVMNACLRPDRTLVLPAWMRRHDNILNFHCGCSEVEFSLPDTEAPPHLARADLVGLTQPRPSMPDFLNDFVPNAVVFDLVYGDHKVSKTCHSRTGTDCDSFPGLSQGFRPAVFLHPRHRSLPEKRSWVRQFVKLMKPPDTGRQAQIIYDDPVDSEQGLQCFRSAFFTRGPYNKHIITGTHLRRIHFLELNGIGKKARDPVRTYMRNGRQRKTCHLNVTISNRKLVDGAPNRLIGRYMMNIPMLKEAIAKQAKRIPGLVLTVETMALEGRSLRWQINGMQKTDIWVAGHGPLLTNMLFLRENSTVLEVQPFTYYPKKYENMARFLAHVKYDRYIAHPDVEGFEKCMRKMYPTKHPSFDKAESMLSSFSKAAEKYSRSDSTHSLTLQNFNDSSLQYVKNCAGMQRLDTNPKNLAITIVRHARLRCGLPKPVLTRSNR